MKSIRSLLLLLLLWPAGGSMVAAMAPPLPPKPLGTFLTGYPATPPTVQIECYLDLVCPFSARMFATLYHGVVPALRSKTQSPSSVAIRMHQVVQPWHPQGTLVHEAALASKRVLNDDEGYLEYVAALCEAFVGPDQQFSDADTWSKPRTEIYDDLLAVFARTHPRADPEQPRSLLVPSEPLVGNSGNAVTQDVKWACKHHRAVGVHVTPTVFCNGIEAVQVSSGWTPDDWMAFFDELLPEPEQMSA